MSAGGFSRDELQSFDRGSRQAGGRLLGWFLVILLVSSLIGGATWGAKVLFSDAKGRGDQIIQNNSAENRTAKQEKFETLFANVVAADQRIAVAKAEYKAAPKDDAARIRYFGAIQFCQQQVADYNSEARKITSEDWRSDDLPYQVSDLDSTTDCKE